ncbi:MAG: hypothetical protein N2203_03965 [Bacteroidia bacterium]|nr:hypothetical protein [Bacteroidia bacterium]
MSKQNIRSSTQHHLKNKNKNSSLYDKCNTFFSKITSSKLLWFFLLTGLFFDFINFNARISEAHDDALYIEAAYRFVNEFPNYFYTANAPFYPMFLAVLYKIFGFNLIIFKLFNVLFHVLSIFFFFQAFDKIIPMMVFIPLMLFLSTNHHIVYFSSMTFTESLFMFLQGLLFFSFRKISDLYHQYKKSPYHSLYRPLIFLGFTMTLLVITRSGAIVVLPAVFFFFWVILKDKKATLLSAGAFLLFFFPYKLLLKLIFGNVSQYSNQSRILLQKDPYDASLGQEDMSGFIQRFIDNSNLYLSKRFFQIIGWMDETNSNTYSIITLVMWALFLWSFWKIYKQKNYFLIFVSLYTLGLIVLSFVILQARWDQPRIIMVAMPVMIVNYFLLFNEWFGKSAFFKNIYILLCVLFSASMLVSTSKRGIKNIPVVIKNLSGDIYYGYTDDWINFLKASEWCGKNLPPTAYVASRKAPMSFVYGKRKFFPIYSVIKKDPETNQSHPDSALAYFKQNGVTHILLANLRIDPNKNTGQVINTIHNILEPIARKYPSALKLVHTEGETESCYVYEINYNIK